MENGRWPEEEHGAGPNSKYGCPHPHKSGHPNVSGIFVCNILKRIIVLVRYSVVTVYYELPNFLLLGFDIVTGDEFR